MDKIPGPLARRKLRRLLSTSTSHAVEIVQVLTLGRCAAFGTIGALENPDFLAVLSTLFALDARQILEGVSKRDPPRALVKLTGRVLIPSPRPGRSGE
jgi:hypothetical protein